jgi:hypothetical protein
MEFFVTKNIPVHTHFWIDPCNFLLFFALPVFVLSGYFAAPYMSEFGSYNFLSPGMLALGAVCICLFAVAAKVGTIATDRVDRAAVAFDTYRFDQALIALLAVTLLAHVLYTGLLLSDPSLVRSVLVGERGAVFTAKDSMTRIVGVTSLTNLSPLVYCLCSVRFVTRGRFVPSPMAGVGLGLLALLVLFHAFIGSERLVLLENGFAFALPLFTYSPRMRSAGFLAPFIGVILVLFIFAYGEFTRSWAFYAHRYDSFGQYLVHRLLAYVAVASNTGAGMFLNMPAAGPLMTAQWLARAPVIGVGNGYGLTYLQQFGNPEFNNPSGVYAALVDFGVGFGLLYVFIFGLAIGAIYGFYRRGHPVGMLAYPLLFVGLADLIQIWYWGGPRFLPGAIALVVTILFVIRRRTMVPVV